ncbi:MAG: hypothetical protein IKC40_07230, partial [Oscillospiraceae bacterium]|nr:hypothetical protein [Oscillospiraceae bacterium]
SLSKETSHQRRFAAVRRVGTILILTSKGMGIGKGGVGGNRKGRKTDRFRLTAKLSKETAHLRRFAAFPLGSPPTF